MIEWIKRICIFLLIIMMFVFYIPDFRFVYNELPKLTEWEQEDCATIRTILPDAFEKRMTLCFWSNHSIMKVYLGDQEIYDGCEESEESFCKIPASRWNYVEVPADSAGKELRVRSESGDIPFVKEYVYGTNEQVNQWLHQHYDFTQLIDEGLIGVGTLFVLFGLTNKRYTDGRKLPLYLGLGSILVGLYLRMGYKGVPIHWMSENTREFIYYFAFFTMMIPMLAYISHKKKLNGLYTKLCNTFVTFQLLFTLAVFTLHGMKICDLSQFVWMGSVFVWIFIIFSILGTILVIVRKQVLSSVLPLLSSGILLMAVQTEYIRVKRWSEIITQRGSIIRISILLIVILEVITFALNMQEIERQKMEVEAENKKLEFQLLSSQIRPHFILNTLGAIRSMISRDAEKASDLLWDFSMYLRNNIEERDYMKQIPFLEELDYIETYLRLEQTRFGERLKVEYDIKANDFRVLPLTIQPFVENAVKHGLFSAKYGGTIRLSTLETEDQILIEIQDDGIGFDTSKLPEILKEKKSVGLRSAIYRIENEMRGICRIISRENGNGGTLVQVILAK